MLSCGKEAPPLLSPLSLILHQERPVWFGPFWDADRADGFWSFLLQGMDAVERLKSGFEQFKTQVYE